MSGTSKGIAPSSPRTQADRAIGNWMKQLETYPGWSAWRKGRFVRTLYDDDFSARENDTHPEEFVFTAEIEQQRDLVVQYLGIEQALQALRDCEYYFRRFPFYGLPVSKHEHLTYMCEMYFSRFYELRERLKKYLNTLVQVESDHRFDIGQFLKTFDRDFDQELRERNQVHHHRRFEDLAIDQVYLAGVMSNRHGSWKDESERFYRKATTEWAQRVRRRAARAEKYVDAVAQTTLDGCTFLKITTASAETPEAARST